jgi:hypothetical protein
MTLGNLVLLHWHRWRNMDLQGDEGYLHQSCRCGLSRTIYDPEYTPAGGDSDVQ